MVHSCVSDIASRRAVIDKALRDGKLDGRALTEHYSYVYKDDATPVLGMGRTGSYSATDSTDDHLAFVVTVLEQDRDGDVVNPAGIELTNYERNPVWFFGHQEWLVPIGTAKSPDGRICVFPDQSEAKAWFFPDMADEDAAFIAGKVRRGILNATSIAFVPIEAWRRDEQRKAHQHEHSPNGWHFNRVDLTEISIVGVPANPWATREQKELRGALRDAVDKEAKSIRPRLRKALEPYCAKSTNESGGCWTGWCPPPKQVTKSDAGALQQKVAKLPAREVSYGDVVWFNREKVRVVGVDRTGKRSVLIELENGKKFEVDQDAIATVSNKSLRRKSIQYRQFNGKWFAYEDGNKVGGPYDTVDDAKADNASEHRAPIMMALGEQCTVERVSGAWWVVDQDGNKLEGPFDERGEAEAAMPAIEKALPRSSMYGVRKTPDGKWEIYSHSTGPVKSAGTFASREEAEAAALKLHNSKKSLRCKGLPEGVSESARQFHMALTRVGYGLGRPRMQGMQLTYDTPDPEDAQMIAGDVPNIANSVGVTATAVANGRKLVVTLKSLRHKAQPSGDISPEKACQILRDGEANGKPLTEAQRGMFGAACARAKKSCGGMREKCLRKRLRDVAMRKSRSSAPGPFLTRAGRGKRAPLGVAKAPKGPFEVVEELGTQEIDLPGPDRPTWGVASADGWSVDSNGNESRGGKLGSTVWLTRGEAEAVARKLNAKKKSMPPRTITVNGVRYKAMGEASGAEGGYLEGACKDVEEKVADTEYDQGYVAAWDGRGLSTNPYKNDTDPKGREMSDDWAAGWRDGAKERLAGRKSMRKAAPKPGDRIESIADFERETKSLQRRKTAAKRHRCTFCKGTGSYGGQRGGCPDCGGRGAVAKRLSIVPLNDSDRQVDGYDGKGWYVYDNSGIVDGPFPSKEAARAAWPEAKSLTLKALNQARRTMKRRKELGDADEQAKSADAPHDVAMAQLYQHAKDHADMVEMALSGSSPFDPQTGEENKAHKALQDYQAKAGETVEALKGMFEEHASGEQKDVEEFSKGMETSGDGASETGEANLVDRGEVPEEMVEADEQDSEVEMEIGDNNWIAEEEAEGHTAPVGSTEWAEEEAQEPEHQMAEEDDVTKAEDEVDHDTEEILERYQKHFANGSSAWSSRVAPAARVRKVLAAGGAIKKGQDGRKWLVASVKKTFNVGDRVTVTTGGASGEEGTVKAPRDAQGMVGVELDSEKGGDLFYTPESRLRKKSLKKDLTAHEPGVHGKALEPDHAEAIKACGNMLKGLAVAPDMPEHHKSALDMHGDDLHKALEDGDHEEAVKAAHKHLKALATAPDLPEHHKDAVDFHAKALRKVLKAMDVPEDGEQKDEPDDEEKDGADDEQVKSEEDTKAEEQLAKELKALRNDKLELARVARMNGIRV
jgi:transcription antitermination factor NusG